MTSAHPPRGRSGPRRARLGLAALAVTSAALSSVLVTTNLAPAVAAGAGALDPAQGLASQLSSPPVASDAPFTKTVTWLLDQMTPAEQMRLIEGSWANKTQTDTSLDPDTHNQAGYVRGVARLGIPEARHADALGIEGFADTTSFPTRIGVAGSFDRDLLALMGQTEGREGKATDTDLLYGPQVDLARTPSWRRNMTAYSEDPYVASQLGVDEINGIQSTGLMSQVKHVSFYSGQDQNIPSIVGEQAAREIYLAPAEAAAKTAHVSSMMCSYATFQIKEYEAKPDYACSNSGMLGGIIKGEWNFPGWITSDYGGAKATSDIVAGLDQEFLTNFLSEPNLLKLIDPASDQYDGTYAAAARVSAARVLYGYERFGMLDNDHIPAAYQSTVAQSGDVDANHNAVNVDKAAGIRVSEELSEAAATLLKNNDATLPLSTGRSVAVIGQTSTLLPASPGGERASGFGDRVNITPLDAMKTIAGAKVTSVPGIDNIGQTVPAAAFSTDANGATPGLTRNTVNPDGSAGATATDTVLDGRQTTLVKGAKYTWTGYVNVPASDTYRLLIQRPFGNDLGDDSKYNQNIRNTSNSTVTLSVDGATKTLANPDTKILQNGYPTFATGVPGVQTRADNGQYLGYENVANTLDLTPGRHAVSITYQPRTTAATTPTLRFAWSPTSASLAAATAAAATNDVSVVYVDDDAARTGDGVSPATDVARLSAAQDNLITSVATAAHAAGKKVVVVLNTGNAVQMPWIDNVDSVLEMWYPGQEGGTATARTLYGQNNPSGKLTLTFPKSSAESLFAGHPERGAGTQDPGEATPTIKWTEGLNIGYRWYRSTENTTGLKPLFAFGHGLSYTTFAYSGLTVKNAANGGLDVSFTVKNTGSVAGAESPQVYIGPSAQLPAGVDQAAIRLAQFDHVQLDPGASKTVQLNIAPRELSSYSVAQHQWLVGEGTRTVWVGTASDDLQLTAQANVVSAVAAPAITSQPQASVSTTAGQPVTLSAQANGTPQPTVVWQVSRDGGASWTTVPGATSASYSFTAHAADSGARYRALFSNVLGDTASTVSKVDVAKASAVFKAKLKAERVTTQRRAKVKTSLTAPAGLSLTGDVTVSVRKGKKVVKTVTEPADAAATIKLPKLKVGTYKVVVAYGGTTDIASASTKLKLRVTRS